MSINLPTEENLFDQGISISCPFRNNATITIANLSNINPTPGSLQDKFPEHNVNLNPIDMLYDDFINLFFGTGYSGAFSISNLPLNVKQILFSTQTYTTNTNPKVKFGLYNQLLKAYEKIYGLAGSSLTPKQTILLERSCFLIKGLNSVVYQTALSFDESMYSLESNGIVEHTKNPCDTAKINFVIVFTYISDILKIKLNIYFHYIVNVPCYILSRPMGDECGECPNPYSNDEHTKKPDYTIKHIYDNKNELIHDDNISYISSDYDNLTMISSETNLIKYINQSINDEQNLSTKW